MLVPECRTALTRITQVDNSNPKKPISVSVIYALALGISENLRDSYIYWKSAPVWNDPAWGTPWNTIRIPAGMTLYKRTGIYFLYHPPSGITEAFTLGCTGFGNFHTPSAASRLLGFRTQTNQLGSPLAPAIDYGLGPPNFSIATRIAVATGITTVDAQHGAFDVARYVFCFDSKHELQVHIDYPAFANAKAPTFKKWVSAAPARKARVEKETQRFESAGDNELCYTRKLPQDSSKEFTVCRPLGDYVWYTTKETPFPKLAHWGPIAATQTVLRSSPWVAVTTWDARRIAVLFKKGLGTSEADWDFALSAPIPGGALVGNSILVYQLSPQHFRHGGGSSSISDQQQQGIVDIGCIVVTCTDNVLRRCFFTSELSNANGSQYAANTVSRWYNLGNPLSPPFKAALYDGTSQVDYWSDSLAGGTWIDKQIEYERIYVRTVDDLLRNPAQPDACWTLTLTVGAIDSTWQYHVHDFQGPPLLGQWRRDTSGIVNGHVSNDDWLAFGVPGQKNFWSYTGNPGYTRALGSNEELLLPAITTESLPVIRPPGVGGGGPGAPDGGNPPTLALARAQIQTAQLPGRPVSPFLPVYWQKLSL